MRIVVAGGTGFIGRPLVEQLTKRGDEVTLLIRSPGKAVAADGTKLLDPIIWSPGNVDAALTSAVAKADAVINLAGEPIADKRWTDAQKSAILNSRIDATNSLVQAIGRSQSEPKVLINGSAIGYYGSRGSEKLTEDNSAGTGFLPDVVRQWETAAMAATEFGVRVALIRTGIVLGSGGGALPRLAMPFKLFGGGVMGPKQQMVSWIHLDDEIGIILKALDDNNASGPINATAPNPVTMNEFSHAIGRVLHRPVWAPGLPTFMGFVLGERTEVVFASLNVTPAKAQSLGYEFSYSDVTSALEAALGKA